MPFGRKAPAPAGLRLFSLDVHHAVISDVKDVLRRIYGDKVAVTDWRINRLEGRCMGYAPAAKNQDRVVHDDECLGGPMLLNHITWYGINTQLVEQFVARYRLDLAAYDGFIVTHSPVFCRLFESFGKPVIVVNSCRYDIPYTWTGNREERAELHECLRRLQAKGLLVAISNNKADQAYLKLGAGIDSVHVPSLCAYTNVSYNLEFAKHHSPLITSEQTRIVPPHVETLLSGAGILRATVHESIEPKKPERPQPSEEPSPSPAPPPPREQRADNTLAVQFFQATPWPRIHQRKALVHFPYEVSTMSVFEQYTAGVPLLFPSRRFFAELAQVYADEDKALGRNTSARARLSAHKYWTQFHSHVVSTEFAAKFGRLSEMVADGEAVVNPIESQSQDSSEPAQVEICFGKEDRDIPHELRETMEPEWWIERADFYDSEWMPFVKYFDSWEELAQLAQESPTADEHAEKVAFLAARREKILSLWRSLINEAFPRAAAFAEEHQKKLEAERQANINQKLVLWEEILDKIPVPPKEKTRWGPHAGIASNQSSLENTLSLAIVEPRQHKWMRATLHNACHIYGGSGARLYIFHGTNNKTFIENMIDGWTGVTLVDIGKPNLTIEEYNRLCASASFYQNFATTHCLIFQTDVLMRRQVPGVC